MPCPEENPCSEVRQSLIALQKADQTLLKKALQSGKWNVIIRTKGVGLFFTRPGVTGWWESGRDMRLEGPVVERAKLLREISHDYAVEVLQSLREEGGWEVVGLQMAQDVYRLSLGRASISGRDLLHFSITEGTVQCDCPPISDENMAAADALLARLNELFGTEAAVSQMPVDLYAAQSHATYA